MRQPKQKYLPVFLVFLSVAVLAALYPAFNSLSALLIDPPERVEVSGTLIKVEGTAGQPLSGVEIENCLTGDAVVRTDTGGFFSFWILPGRAYCVRSLWPNSQYAVRLTPDYRGTLSYEHQKADRDCSWNPVPLGCSDNQHQLDRDRDDGFDFRYELADYSLLLSASGNNQNVNGGILHAYREESQVTVSAQMQPPVANREIRLLEDTFNNYKTCASATVCSSTFNLPWTNDMPVGEMRYSYAARILNDNKNSNSLVIAWHMSPVLYTTIGLPGSIGGSSTFTYVKNSKTGEIPGINIHWGIDRLDTTSVGTSNGTPRTSCYKYSQGPANATLADWQGSAGDMAGHFSPNDVSGTKEISANMLNNLVSGTYTLGIKGCTRWGGGSVPESRATLVIQDAPMNNNINSGVNRSLSLVASGNGQNSNSTLTVPSNTNVSLHANTTWIAPGEKIQIFYKDDAGSFITFPGLGGNVNSNSFVFGPLAWNDSEIMEARICEVNDMDKCWNATSPDLIKSNRVAVLIGSSNNNTNSGGGNVQILSFMGSPTSISSGQSATLSWTTQNATSCDILNSSSQQVNTTPLPGNGSLPVTLTSTQTYRLTCRGNNNSQATSNPVTITVPIVTPKYKCSGTSCVRDDVNGTYSESTCNNQCGSSQTGSITVQCSPASSCSGATAVLDYANIGPSPHFTQTLDNNGQTLFENMSANGLAYKLTVTKAGYVATVTPSILSLQTTATFTVTLTPVANNNINTNTNASNSNVNRNANANVNGNGNLNVNHNTNINRNANSNLNLNFNLNQNSNTNSTQKYACSLAGQCQQDLNGSYLVSNCNNECRAVHSCLTVSATANPTTGTAPLSVNFNASVVDTCPTGSGMWTTPDTVSGGKASSGGGVIFNNTLYVATTEEVPPNFGNRLVVKSYANGTWTDLPGNGLNEADPLNVEPSLAVSDNKLYIIWQQYKPQAQIRVKRYDPATQSWSAVDNGGLRYSQDQTRALDAPRLLGVDNNLFAMWQENNADTVSQIRMKRYTGGTSWEAFDNGGLNANPQKTAMKPALTVFGNQLYVTFLQEASGSDGHVHQVRVKKTNLTQASWQDVGGVLNFNPDTFAESPDIYALDNTLYAAWAEVKEVVQGSSTSYVRQIRVKKYSGSAWVSADGNTGPGNGINFDTDHFAFNPHLGSFQQQLFAIWRENDRVRVKKHTGSAWESAEGSGGSGLGALSFDSPYLIATPTDLFALWQASASIMLKKYDPSGSGGGTPTYQYKWNFGDGNSSDLKNPTKTYGTGGNFTANVRVNSSTGLSNMKNVSVNVTGGGACTLRGDVNCSGAVTITDLALVRSFIVNHTTVTAIRNGDVNTCPAADRRNENVTVTDVAIYRRYLVSTSIPKAWPISCAD